MAAGGGGGFTSPGAGAADGSSVNEAYSDTCMTRRGLLKLLQTLTNDTANCSICDDYCLGGDGLQTHPLFSSGGVTGAGTNGQDWIGII